MAKDKSFLRVFSTLKTREALVYSRGQTKNLTIPEGFYPKKDSDMLTLYRLGDEVLGGVGQGWTIIGWVEPRSFIRIPR